VVIHPFKSGPVVVKSLVRISASLLPLFVYSTYAAEKPTPVEQFFLARGLEATVWAAAPQVNNPTNMDTDVKGRIWVTEAVNYRSFRNMESVDLWREKGDRVMVLEDTNGDGKADSSHMFVQDEDLVAPMGISVLGNRVFVTCSPNVIVYTDVDGDARFDPSIDRKEILLSGFGGFDHDHSLHTVKAGPDGDLYLTTGNAGPHKVTDKSGWTLRAGSSYRGGSPSNQSNAPGLISDDGRMYVGGLALRIEPDGTRMRVIGHNFRNPYELCLDSFGNVFQNDNDDTISCRTTWVMEYGSLGFASADGERTWRAGHRPGQSTPRAHWRQDDPGIIPAGDIYGPGSPTGIEYYENGALGPEFENTLLSAEAGRNLIWSYRVEPSGAGYELRRSTLFASTGPGGQQGAMDKADTRKWFRPSDVLVGSDGAIYVADFFDPFIGGHRMLETEGNGVIYRITRKGDNPRPPEIDLGTAQGAIAALRNPAHSIRFSGLSRLTDEPTDEGVDALLELANHENPRFAARAIFALARIGASQAASTPYRNEAWSSVMEMLVADNPELRIAAFRAARRYDPAGVAYRASYLSTDPSPGVRREALLALRDLPPEVRKPIIVKLAQTFDGHDRWYLEAIGTASEGVEEAVWMELGRSELADSLQWSDGFVAITWRLHPSASINGLAKRALSNTLPPDERRRALDALSFIPDRKAAESVLKVAMEGSEETRSYAAWWIQSRSTNDWENYRLVEKLPADPEAEALAEKNRQMARGRNQLKNATELSDEIRKIAVEMALSPIGAPYLLHLAGRNELPDFIYPAIAERIHENPDVSVRALATRFFPDPKSSAGALPPLGDIANLEGDVDRGRELFGSRGACATCHIHGDTGIAIGPDLTEVGNRFDRTALLDSIVNPSAAIAFGYEATIVTTNDGQTYSGFVVGDGDTLILKEIGGQQRQIPGPSIASRQKLEQSIMPSGASIGLGAQDLADIVAFLSK
jgi:putative membrane-bound dehydrogenase-like protein